LIGIGESTLAVGRNGLASEAQRVHRLRRANTLLEQRGLRPPAQPRARLGQRTKKYNQKMAKILEAIMM
jgi:hypothetical protein